jgi:hypothetical protein
MRAVTDIYNFEGKGRISVSGHVLGPAEYRIEARRNNTNSPWEIYGTLHADQRILRAAYNARKAVLQFASGKRVEVIVRRLADGEDIAPIFINGVPPGLIPNFPE